MAGTAPLAVLLPPSEGKALGGEGAPWDPASGTFAALAPHRTKVAAALRKAKGGDAKLLGVGGAHLSRAQDANRTVIGAPALPAAQRYTGVVYDHLGLATLPAAARRRASSSIVVLSGLLGAVGIDDPTPDYRLKMGARLAPLGTMQRWWKPALSDALNEWLTGRVVIDLLPNEHAAAWAPSPPDYAAFLRVSFVERAADRPGKVVGHDAKAAKGALVRHLLTSRAAPARALASFEHERFVLQITA